MKNCFGLSSRSVAWLNKYYPIPAERVTSKWAWLRAVKYSLLKWKGLRTDILDKYNLIENGAELLDGESFVKIVVIGERTCHLCVRAGAVFNKNNCKRCPFVKILNNLCCEGATSPYGVWIDSYNPEPMIKSLEEIYRVLKRDPKFMSKQTPL